MQVQQTVTLELLYEHLYIPENWWSGIISAAAMVTQKLTEEDLPFQLIVPNLHDTKTKLIGPFYGSVGHHFPGSPPSLMLLADCWNLVGLLLPGHFRDHKLIPLPFGGWWPKLRAWTHPSPVLPGSDPPTVSWCFSWLTTCAIACSAFHFCPAWTGTAEWPSPACSPG